MAHCPGLQCSQVCSSQRVFNFWPQKAPKKGIVSRAHGVQELCQLCLALYEVLAQLGSWEHSTASDTTQIWLQS